MKKILFTLTLIFTLNSFSQVVYDRNNQDFFINYDTNKLNLNYEGTMINGSFQELKGSDYYTYIVANGGDYHLIMKKFTSYEFYGIDLLKGEYKDVLKGFKKNRKYGKKVEVVYSSLPSSEPKEDFDLISEKQLEKIKKIENYGSSVKESGYIGIYNIKIIKHRNLDFNKEDYFGKIYVSEDGVTIETEIPTVDLLRGSYDVDMSGDAAEGRFICNINKGFGDYFSISINKKSGVGAFTKVNGSISTTTTFSIQK